MSEAKMKIKSIAPWFGGKRTLAPKIVSELGPHRAYWEPFCGSMAVLLAKPPCCMETVNDLHGDMINLARVVQDTDLGPALYRRLRRVLMDERIRDEAIEKLDSIDDMNSIDRAYWYFIASWIGRNGFSGTRGCMKASFAVRWTPGGGHGGKRLHSAVESIPEWRRRIRNVTILKRDAFAMIQKIEDHPQSVIYCDPPYLSSSRASGQYQHEFTNYSEGVGGDDHARLAWALKRFQKARVVVSYYDDERLGVLYPDWTQVNCTVNKGIHNAGRRGVGGKKAPEVLLINGPSLTEVK